MSATSSIDGASYDVSALRASIGRLGPLLDAETLRASIDIYRAHIYRVPNSTLEAHARHFYGPDQRNRLEVFYSIDVSALRPVLVFVHGGGFIGGDTVLPGTPFYDNIGLWAVDNGLVGVNLAYRLAPAHTWPAADEDLRTAASWLHDHVVEFGGDPDRIVLLGSSAGATLIANFLASTAESRTPIKHVRGAILRSGIYDLARLPASQVRNSLAAYFGEDAMQSWRYSPLPRMAASQIPFQLVAAEFDPPMFFSQVDAVLEITSGDAGLEIIAGQNHFSADFQLGSLDGAFGALVLSAITQFTDHGRYSGAQPAALSTRS